MILTLMDKITRYIVVAAVSIMAAASISCTRGDKEWHPISERDSFVELKGERVFGDVEFIFPQRLVSIGDMLLVQDSNLPDGKMFMALHADSTREPTYHLSQGLGPGEYMNTRIVDYSASDSTIYIFDSAMSKGRLFRIDPESIYFSEANMLAEYKLPPTGRDNHRLATGLVSDIVTDGKMFTLMDTEGAVLKSFGDYPGNSSGIELSPRVFEMSHQVVMATNSCGDRVAAVGRNSDWIVFYSLSGGNPRQIKEYFSSESPYEVDDLISDDTEMISVNITDNSRTYFTDLIPTAEYLYAVYDGSTEKERKDGTAQPATIMKFDWDGNLVEGYVMPEISGVKTVRQDGKYLYAAVADGASDNMIIKRYLLP